MILTLLAVYYVQSAGIHEKGRKHGCIYLAFERGPKLM